WAGILLQPTDFTILSPCYLLFFCIFHCLHNSTVCITLLFASLYCLHLLLFILRVLCVTGRDLVCEHSVTTIRNPRGSRRPTSPFTLSGRHCSKHCAIRPPAVDCGLPAAWFT